MMQISLNFVENINQVCNLLWHMTTDYIKICSVTGELIIINLPTHFHRNLKHLKQSISLQVLPVPIALSFTGLLLQKIIA